MSADAAAKELPFHLRGNYAPVFEEVTATDLPVTGAIPPALRGLYVRNGPNPRSGESAHWFVGDGMLHGVRLEDGAARWYRNRWVQTRALVEGASFIDDDLVVDHSVGVANTNVVGHAGRIFALVESSFPTEMTGELGTVGVCDFDGRLATSMTAHPKTCPVTGELHFFGYRFLPPFLTYHRLDAAGRLVQSEDIPVPGPTMIHDFAITAEHVIFMDLPVVFSADLAVTGKFPYQWSDDYGARLGVMPRGGRSSDVRWFEITPCYVFHPFNAYAEGSTVVLDVARYQDLWRADASSFGPAFPHRFTIDLAGGRVREQPLDDRPVEFPRVDERRAGLAHRFGYAVGNQSDVGQEARTLFKYDFRTGATETHDFGPAHAPSEAVFVAAPDGRGEDEGWLLQYVYDEARDGSDLVILDATGLGAKPVAVVRLPQRVPFGFHGNWIPDAA
jgi:carotenoid cleavage dioxygenase-like enzyme